MTTTSRLPSPAAPRPRRSSSALSEPFAALPHAIAGNPEVPPTAKALLLALLFWARAGSTCWPSDSSIGKRIGRHPGTVSRWLGWLQARGLIRREPADNRTGRLIVLCWRETPAAPALGGVAAVARDEEDVIVKKSQEGEPGGESDQRQRSERTEDQADPTPPVGQLNAAPPAEDQAEEAPSGRPPFTEDQRKNSEAPGSSNSPPLTPKQREIGEVLGSSNFGDLPCVNTLSAAPAKGAADGDPPAPPAKGTRKACTLSAKGTQPTSTPAIPVAARPTTATVSPVLTPAEAARLDELPDATRDRATAWLLSGDPILVREARRILTPPAPKPEPPATVEELLSRLREDPAHVATGAAALCRAFDDPRSFAGYHARLAEAWRGERDPAELVEAFRQASGPKAKRPGALFMHCLSFRGS